jgi:hypothetical protein
MIYLRDVPGIMRDPMKKDSLIPSVTGKRSSTCSRRNYYGRDDSEGEISHARAKSGREEGAFHRQLHPALAPPGIFTSSGISPADNVCGDLDNYLNAQAVNTVPKATP